MDCRNAVSLSHIGRGLAFALFLAMGGCVPAAAETWSLHAQATFVEQFHPGFSSPYRGANSMDPAARGNETFDATLFAGVRLWDGGALYLNPEIDQGFGLSNTLGVAGYVSGEAYKVGQSVPYVRLQRVFLRQSFDLGGETQTLDPAANQLGGTTTADNLILTFGKISVGDVFDANAYAHDQRSDFLNWAVIDSGAFDYAADAWGYTYGATAELTTGRWSIRAGLFDLSRIPNTTALQRGLAQFEIVGEVEERHQLWGMAGKLKLLGFVNRGRMGAYKDAVAAGPAPDMAAVRKYASRPGLAVNLEQQLDENLGAFARLSWNDGSKEAYEFTEINRSLALGLSLTGSDWKRPADTIGAAMVINGLSEAAKGYFAAGGMGILIGDGRLGHYGTENIAEVYYAVALAQGLTATADYQLVVDPAYNRDRGPVSVLGARLHAQI